VTYRLELVSGGTSGRSRTVEAGSVRRSAFTTGIHGEDFAPRSNCAPDDESARHATKQHFLSAIDPSDSERVTRALRVFEQFLDDFDDRATEALKEALRRDGYELASDGTIIQAVHRVDGLRRKFDALNWLIRHKTRSRSKRGRTT
jgi:hypothetical protein